MAWHVSWPPVFLPKFLFREAGTATTTSLFLPVPPLLPPTLYSSSVSQSLSPLSQFLRLEKDFFLFIV